GESFVNALFRRERIVGIALEIALPAVGAIPDHAIRVDAGLELHAVAPCPSDAEVGSLSARGLVVVGPGNFEREADGGDRYVALREIEVAAADVGAHAGFQSPGLMSRSVPE